jgi:raffinose/stachyose/melibiose transport system permease protein
MATATAASPGARSRTDAVPKRPRSGRSRVNGTYWFMLVPALVLFTLAITLPAIMGITISFTDSVGFGEFSWVGLTNYVALFSDPAIRSAYGFTIGLALVTVLVVNAAAFLLAVLLCSRIRAKVALRAIFVLPMVISGIIIAYVFSFLFANSLPQLGQAIGVDVLASSLLANEDLAWLTIVFVTAWQSIPSALLIYIAGILSIPSEVYEAASMDGASAGRRLRSITLPLVAGYVIINLIIGFKNYLNSYDIIVGLTNGGPGTATRSVAMAIFAGYTGGDYAYQMANATIFFLIAVVLAVLQLRFTRGKAAF